MMNTDKNVQNQKIKTALGALAWLLVWQLASMAVGEGLLLPSPLAVVQALWQLVFTPVFWGAVWGSLWRLGLGFAAAFVLGVLLAVAAAASSVVEVLLRPLMLLMRAIPVASFIILMLVWVSNRYLGTVASFLMVLPVIYGGTYGGIKETDTGMLEMALVFRIGFWRRLRAIYLPAAMPSLLTACELALGLCWKSGVAAEIIGLPRGTIGERLYQAKLYLMMPEMFAWTAVIILLSWLFGKLVIRHLRRLAKRLERGRADG